MSSTSQFNGNTDSPKTPTRSNDQNNLLLTPGSEKTDRYAFPSPAWSPSTGLGFPSPTNIISPSRNAGAYFLYDTNLISPRNYSYEAPSPNNFQNIQSIMHYNIVSPNNRQNILSFPKVPQNLSMKRKRSNSMGSTSVESEGSSNNQSIAMNAQSHQITALELQTLEEDALDSTSSNRPNKRQKLQIIPGQQEEYQNLTNINEGMDYQNNSIWMNQDSEELRYIPNMMIHKNNAGQNLLIDNAQPNSLVNNLIWPNNIFPNQSFDVEPKARRRLTYNMNNNYNPNENVYQLHYNNNFSQYPVLDDQSNRKQKRKRKKKRKGHTITDKDGKNRGTWTDEEHERFEQALKIYEKGKWKEISAIVRTRTRVQCASHAQKVEIRNKREKELEEFDDYE